VEGRPTGGGRAVNYGEDLLEAVRAHGFRHVVAKGNLVGEHPDQRPTVTRELVHHLLSIRRGMERPHESGDLSGGPRTFAVGYKP